MLTIDTLADVPADLPPSIREILDLRADLIDLATFVIVQAEDHLTAVESKVGFSIVNSYPPWEWVLDHGGIFEAPIITSDDGSGIVLLVPNDPDVDQTLLAILRQQAETADTDSGSISTET